LTFYFASVFRGFFMLKREKEKRQREKGDEDQ